jgi:hypothetical protein
MKKPLLIFLITSSFFIFPKTHPVFAQSCNCIRQAEPGSYDLTTKTFQYSCKPDPSTSCPDPTHICQCQLDACTGITGSECSKKPCPSGTCIYKECEPPFYCIDKCNNPVTFCSCPSGLIGCQITWSQKKDDCVSNCNTKCVFGNTLPGFTCGVEEKTGQLAGEKTCACYPPSITPGQSQPIPTLNPWGKCGTNVAIDTALGCIPVDPSLFVQTFITLIIGLAGVIAFLLMVFAAIKIILAGGNPEKLQAGKEMLTSAIIGLILIIFSTVILELIGVHILQIPGFLEFK